MILNPSYIFFKEKYKPFFKPLAENTAINDEVLLQISYDLVGNKIKLQKLNNLFAIYNAGKPIKYSNIFDGITAGINIIINNPNFLKLKIGTLKANPILQYNKLKNLLSI